MPARPRTARPLFAAVVALVALAGVACGGVEQQPTEYGQDYEDNFMFGCTGVEPNSDGQYEDPSLAPVSYCECVYEGLVEKVPFDDAKEFEEQQAEEEAGQIEVPDNIQAVYDDCEKPG